MLLLSVLIFEVSSQVQCGVTGRTPSIVGNNCKNYDLCYVYDKVWKTATYTCPGKTSFNPLSEMCETDYVCPVAVWNPPNRFSVNLKHLPQQTPHKTTSWRDFNFLVFVLFLFFSCHSKLHRNKFLLIWKLIKDVQKQIIVNWNISYHNLKIFLVLLLNSHLILIH